MTTLAPLRLPGRTAAVADRRVLAAALAGGIAMDVGIRNEVASIGGAIAALLVAGALLGSGRVTTVAGRLCAANVAVFGAFLALRTSPWLLVLDLPVIVTSAVLAVLLGREGRLDDLDVRLLLGRARGAVLPAATGGAFVTAPVRGLLDPEGRRDHVFGVARGLALAVPVVVLLGALLASADAVFARMTQVEVLVPAELAAHLVLLLLGTLVTAGLLHVASSSPAEALPPLRRRLGSVEWTIVLGSVVALFTAFAIAQLIAVSDGGRRVLATEGLTYAEYARTGWFQLLAVAALAAGLVVGLGAVAERRTPAAERRFTLLAVAVVALTLVVLGIAVRRLAIYEDAYGWTMLRLVVKASAVWLGASFVLLGVRLAGVGGARRWLLPAVGAVALVVVAALNLADPEAAVVRHNVARGAAGHEVDPAYLAALSDDAVPVVLDAFERGDLGSEVLGAVCSAGLERPGLRWNRSADRAEAARDRVCP